MGTFTPGPHGSYVPPEEVSSAMFSNTAASAALYWTKEDLRKYVRKIYKLDIKSCYTTRIETIIRSNYLAWIEALGGLERVAQQVKTGTFEIIFVDYTIDEEARARLHEFGIGPDLRVGGGEEFGLEDVQHGLKELLYDAVVVQQAILELQSSSSSSSSSSISSISSNPAKSSHASLLSKLDPTALSGFEVIIG